MLQAYLQNYQEEKLGNYSVIYTLNWGNPTISNILTLHMTQFQNKVGNSGNSEIGAHFRNSQIHESNKFWLCTKYQQLPLGGATIIIESLTCAISDLSMHCAQKHWLRRTQAQTFATGFKFTVQSINLQSINQSATKSSSSVKWLPSWY